MVDSRQLPTMSRLQIITKARSPTGKTQNLVIDQWILLLSCWFLTCMVLVWEIAPSSYFCLLSELEVYVQCKAKGFVVQRLWLFKLVTTKCSFGREWEDRWTCLCKTSFSPIRLACTSFFYAQSTWMVLSGRNPAGRRDWNKTVTSRILFGNSPSTFCSSSELSFIHDGSWDGLHPTMTRSSSSLMLHALLLWYQAWELDAHVTRTRSKKLQEVVRPTLMLEWNLLKQNPRFCACQMNLFFLDKT